MTFLALIIVVLSSAVIPDALGQQLLFQESDFGAPETVDTATIIVERVDSNSSPLTLTLRPITIGEYLASGRTGCQLDGEYNPAEKDDFNSTAINLVLPPSNKSRESFTIQVPLLRDNIVEENEIFAIILEVSGSETATVLRNCTIVRIQSMFEGQFLRWTYRGQAVNSSLSLELAEGSGSQVVMTVERLVAAEVTTTLTLRRVVGTFDSKDFTINTTFTLPPDQSSVDLVMIINDDNFTEKDERIEFRITATAPGVAFFERDNSRTVEITILDNGVLNYQFLNTASTVSVVEGENITLVSGLNPKVPTGDRSLEILQIISESGSAVEGIDFVKIDNIFLITEFEHPQLVQTKLIPGPQPSRNFTIHLVPGNPSLPLHSQTRVEGMVTILIKDTFNKPIAPSITDIQLMPVGENERVLKFTWSQKTSHNRPVESYDIFTRSCHQQPCNINPNSQQPVIRLTNGRHRELVEDVVLKYSVFSVVVCAANSLGRNCSSTVTIEEPTTDATANSPAKRNLAWVAAIVVLFIFFVAAILALIILGYLCRKHVWKTYDPNKAKGKTLKGQSEDLYAEEVPPTKWSTAPEIMASNIFFD